MVCPRGHKDVECCGVHCHTAEDSGLMFCANCHRATPTGQKKGYKGSEIKTRVFLGISIEHPRTLSDKLLWVAGGVFVLFMVFAAFQSCRSCEDRCPKGDFECQDLCYERRLDQADW